MAAVNVSDNVLVVVAANASDVVCTIVALEWPVCTQGSINLLLNVIPPMCLIISIRDFLNGRRCGSC